MCSCGCYVNESFEVEIHRHFACQGMLAADRFIANTGGSRNRGMKRTKLNITIGVINRGFIAKAEIVISAPIAKVWDALVNPETIKQYMFGTNVISDWKEGSPIVWKGEWQGKTYEDKGVILRLVPRQIIQYSHFSPLSGLPDAPENYHSVGITLSEKGTQTFLSLSQDNNSTEKSREHSEKNWTMMLEGLKKLLER
jgi:uncharacterized protein YndB with AHSA1/START domain